MRSVLAVAVALTAYFLAPIGEAVEGEAIVRLVVAVVGLIAVVVLLVASVTRSPTPVMRAIEAISVSVALLLVVSASIHLAISTSNPAAYSESLGHVDALYLSMMTMTTVGFGDVGTASSGARIAVMVQMVVNVLVLGVAIRVVTRVATNRRRALHPEE